MTALHIGAPQEGFLCSCCRLLLHALSSVAANRCCLESKISGTGVSSDSLISAYRRVMGSVPRMKLASQWKKS